MNFKDTIEKVTKHKDEIFKWIFIAFVAVALFVLLVIKPITVYEANYNDTYQYDLSSLDLYGYDFQWGRYLSYGEDPQMVIYPKNQAINRIEFEFSEPFKSDSLYQIYFQTINSPFSEYNSCQETIKSGTQRIVVDFGENIYTAIRFDLNADFGLKSITISNVSNVNTHTEFQIRIWGLCVYALIVLSAILIKMVFRNKALLVHRTIKKRYFSEELIVDNKNATKTANIYFALAMAFGCLIIFLAPPFTTPDEYTHYLNTCRVYNGYFFPNIQNGVSGCYVTRSQLSYYQTFSNCFNGVDGLNFSYVQMYNLISQKDNSDIVFYALGNSVINPMAYVVPAFFSKIISLLANGLSPYSLMISGKLANLLVSSLIIRKAIMVTGTLRNTMFLLSLMPMTIYQCASLSYDAILIAGMFLLFAYITKLIRSEEGYVATITDICGMVVACVCIFGTKYAYATIMLLLLAIPMKKFGEKKRYLTCIAMAVASFLLFYFIPTLLVSARVASTAAVSSQPMQQSDYFTLSRLPTILHQTMEYFLDTRIEQFFGVLGLIDTRFATPFVVVFLLILSIVGITEICMTDKVKYDTRVFAIVGVGIFFFAFFYTIYTSWTPIFSGGQIGGNVAYGGQGRYYIPLVPFALIAFANGSLSTVKGNGEIKTAIGLLSKTIASAFLGLTVSLLFVHYWL